MNRPPTYIGIVTDVHVTHRRGRLSMSVTMDGPQVSGTIEYGHTGTKRYGVAAMKAMILGEPVDFTDCWVEDEKMTAIDLPREDP